MSDEQQSFPLDVDVTRPDLDVIEARVNETTPGPWLVDPNDPLQVWTAGDSVMGGTVHDPDPRAYTTLIHTTQDGYPRGDYSPAEDATFIAAAREDVPHLIAYVRLLEAQVDKLRAGGSVPR